MDAKRFETLTRSLTLVGSRRWAVAAVLGGVLGGLAIGNEAEGKKKKKKRRSPPPIIIPPPPPPPPPRQGIDLSGIGPQITQSFYLGAGRYIAAATITATSSTGGLFFADLYGPNGYVDFVFIENPEAPGSYFYQEIVEVRYDGLHFFDIDESEGSWRITMSPI